jgi:hypothetical protein
MCDLLLVQHKRYGTGNFVFVDLLAHAFRNRGRVCSDRKQQE